MNEDLWPEITDDKTISPKALMLEQAESLTNKTNKILLGRISTSGQKAKKLQYNFTIVAPALDNYTYLLFVVHHGLTYYPLSFVVGNTSKSIDNEESFIASMKDLFNSEGTKKVLTSLYSQSKE